MKPHASLINPSRGNLVDDAAANRAVSENRLRYYVVDDPVNGPRAIHKHHPRIICTNHNAGMTVESGISTGSADDWAGDRRDSGTRTGVYSQPGSLGASKS